ncbi:MAG: protein kinase domain-containing protein [Gemmatimonadota bacterium]|jgi:serine/threonine-protein kinase
MFCTRCGSEISGTSKFCPSCGLDLTATTPVRAMATGAVAELDLVREALATEYEIFEELGRGGMALVFRAKDRHLEREVAVKVLPFTLAFDAEFVERFQREARTAAQLEHPNIIPIYRVGRSGRVIYFIMKYLRGGSLATLVGERKTLTPPEIRRVLVEAGSALGYAAQRGIVHRDIKPDNIMFDEFGQCVLTDFGIAKAASGGRLTGTGMSIGTPHYMSPEQARAQPIDGRSDIYSLGVVAYQCLAGVVPYDGEDSFSIGYKHITEPIPTPQLINADERRLFEVIKRMLMKDPADRFQTCEELIASLQGQPIATSGFLRVAAGSTPARATVPPAAAAASAAAAPAIASQPTTPINSPSVERRARPRPERGIADRSPVMRRKKSSPFAWVALLLIAAGGGAFFYFRARAGAETPAVRSDSTAADTAGKSATLAARDTTRADTAAASAPPATTPAPAPAKPPKAGPTPVAAVPAPAPTPGPAPRAARADTASAPAGGAVDSGGVRIVDLPRGSDVLIDEKPVTEPVTRLAPGPHALAISAPLHNFYADTIVVEAGKITEVRPQLTRLGAPLPQRARRALAARGVSSCSPGPTYNADGSCFDERPKPVAAPFVPVPGDAAEPHPRPSILWVKVSAEGKTEEVQPLRPSNDPAFERDVRAFADQMSWYPATKAGQAVEGWTQMIFRPQP